MFRIVENIQSGESESSRHVLPLQFPTRAGAVEHIEMLQAQFIRRGRNEEQDHWWARNDGGLKLYRWWVEGMTARGSIEAKRREHEAKTTRLSEARLAKETLQPPPAAKPQRRPRGWP